MKSVEVSKKEWYIYQYSLNYTSDVCGKTLYFEAKGHNSTSWTEKPEVTCKLFLFFHILYYCSRCLFHVLIIFKHTQNQRDGSVAAVSEFPNTKREIFGKNNYSEVIRPKNWFELKKIQKKKIETFKKFKKLEKL